MTTENLAILCTDMVGSTELSQRLSAEEADEARKGALLDPSPGNCRSGRH